MPDLIDHTLYIRGLRHVKHTVFCVDEGQKQYFDPMSRSYVGYSSGQQVKRSLIDRMLGALGAPRAEMTFRKEENKQGGIKTKEVFSDCDPRHLDLLVGGWMRAVRGESTIKRRSPLSVSALTPLHGTLTTTTEEVLTVDRRDDPADRHTIAVVDRNGDSVDDVDAFFAERDRVATRHQFTDKQRNKRLTGLFEYVVAVDLTRLFAVAKRVQDPELADDVRDALQDAGWPEDDDAFYLPNSDRERLIPALARALIEWRVTSNQQRTFSLQNNLATVITRHAGQAANAIYVTQEDERATPHVEAIDGVSLYLTNEARALFDEGPFAADANQQAIDELTDAIQTYSDALPS
jgi:hypothetical protein